MKKAIWIVFFVLLIIAFLYFFFTKTLGSENLIIFSILYGIQLILGLLFLTLLDKSRNQIYLLSYFIVSAVVFLILVFRMI
ncbi:MAG: hypothetical protein K9G58_02285 [Bacteroidales bacterium]|nr:hypothetical protein [Bacteroidales bacterium]MCF8396965.1 hypothetical protein [Bacteroidales bacterium]